MRRRLAVFAFGLGCYLVGRAMRAMDDSLRVHSACALIGVLAQMLPDVPKPASASASIVRLPYAVKDPIIHDLEVERARQ